jgi:acyl dehydratase
MDEKYSGLDEKLRPFIREKAARIWSAWPLEASAVRAYCSAVEDANPVYWDEQVAVRSRFGRLIAPPHALMSLNIDAWWLPPYLRDEVDRQRAANPEMRARAVLADYGLQTVTVVDREEEYLEPFGPGDGRMGRDRWISAISPVKRTKVGTGVFMTYEIEYYTEREERLVARARNVTLIYNGSASVR